MNCYGKVILYIYPALEEVSAQIDDLVMRRALASFSDTSDCAAQAERIIGYIHQKDLLMELKLGVDAVLEKFSEEDVKYFEYKYFKRKPKSFFEGFDAAGRGYFRKQIKLYEEFCERLEKRGFTESRFERDYLPMDFMRDLVRRVERSERKAAELAVRRRKTAVGAKAGAGAE